MSHKKANPQPAKKPMDKKKIITIAVVTVVVIIAAILVDNMIRNPRCKDETDAMNVIIQKVLPSLDEIADDEGFGLEVKELETIGDAEYYPVYITRFPKCEDADAAKRVVNDRVLPTLEGVSAGDVIDLEVLETVTMSDDLPYFPVVVRRTVDGEKKVVNTVFVKAKNSQPFLKGEDGKLTAAAEQEELPITTIYVKTKNSQPFVKDNTTGQLIPYGG